MNLFIKEGMVFPIEIPLILFAPDSAWSNTFFSFSSEKALFASNNSFFSFYLSLDFMAGSNFFITSPSKSLAPSGGFYF